MLRALLIFYFPIILLNLSCLKKMNSPHMQMLNASESIQTVSRFKYYGDFRVDVSTNLHPKASSGFQAYSSLPWKNGVIPVQFSSTISRANQEKFWQACQVWANVAKIECRNKRLADKNFLLITDQMKERCWTDLGAGNNGGKRVFNFALDWCWEKTALIHEIGHVLGLMHEHQRIDRDLFIEIHIENAGEFSFAYDRLSVGPLDKSGPYDFMSIMHYWEGAYSINGKPIMVPRKGYESFAMKMGRSKTLTPSDRQLITSIYGAR